MTNSHIDYSAHVRGKESNASWKISLHLVLAQAGKSSLIPYLIEMFPKILGIFLLSPGGETMKRHEMSEEICIFIIPSSSSISNGLTMHI